VDEVDVVSAKSAERWNPKRRRRKKKRMRGHRMMSLNKMTN
jgi:hypothetical protein